MGESRWEQRGRQSCPGQSDNCHYCWRKYRIYYTMKTGKNIFEYGFTLIEVIITLVVIAVVAAMIAVYFGTSYTQSSVPISRLMAAENLNKIMEKITGDYNNAPTTWSPGTAYTSGTAPPTVVLPTEANRNGYQYVCSSAGTSGAGTGTHSHTRPNSGG